MANRRPPSGAPNADAAPHATPHVMKSRRSHTFRKRVKRFVSQPSVSERPCVRPETPVCKMKWGYAVSSWMRDVFFTQYPRVVGCKAHFKARCLVPC